VKLPGDPKIAAVLRNLDAEADRYFAAQFKVTDEDRRRFDRLLARDAGLTVSEQTNEAPPAAVKLIRRLRRKGRYWKHIQGQVEQKLGIKRSIRVLQRWYSDGTK
jgi:hypothetical protein